MFQSEPSELDYSYKFMKRHIDRKYVLKTGASLHIPVFLLNVCSSYWSLIPVKPRWNCGSVSIKAYLIIYQELPEKCLNVIVGPTNNNRCLLLCKQGIYLENTRLRLITQPRHKRSVFTLCTCQRSWQISWARNYNASLKLSKT